MKQYTQRQPLSVIGIALSLPVLIFLVLQFFFLLSNEKKDVEARAMMTVEQISALGDLQVESEINSMKILVTSSVFSSGDWQSATRRFKEIASFNPHWKNLLVYDSDTRELVVSLHPTEKEALPVLPVEAALKPIVGGVVRGGTGCPCVYLYVPIPSTERTHFVLAVAVDPLQIQKILMTRLPEGTVGAILDHSGKFIARTVDYEARAGTPATIYVRNAMANDDRGIYAGVTYEGMKNYTAFFNSPQSGWSTHIAFAPTLIDAPRFGSIVVLSLGGLVALLIAGGFVQYILRAAEDTAAARLGAIVATSDDAIISKDLNGIITTWNEGAERIFGYTPAEAIGQHVSIIIPPDRLSEETEIISKVRQGERVDHFETVRRGKGGRLIDLSITFSPVKDKKGRIIGVSKIGRDVTERIRSEAQLKEERETLETLNRLAPALAANLDLQSLVQLATDEATKLTGAAFGAFFHNVTGPEGKAYDLYTLSGAPKEAFAHLGMPRATEIFGPTFRGEGTILLEDVHADPRFGRNKPHNGLPKGHLPVRSYLAVPVVSRNGEVLGGMFFGHPEPGVFAERDARIVEGIAAQTAIGIDNAKLYEQVKHALERAEAASRAKTDFLATMSHEIRTPMNAVVGLSSLLASSKPLTPRQGQYIETLQTSANSLLSLINDLLDISKIEASSIRLERVPLSIHAIVSEVVDMLSVRAKEKGLSLTTVNKCPDLDSRLYMGDPTRLRQIVNNLCSNALKFTDTGGVVIEISCTSNAENKNTEIISISVRDTGIGIPKDKQTAIFEKFIQADTSITRKYGGTGLGLAICRTLSDLMGGQLSLESEPGKGSVFTFSIALPRAKEGAQMAHQASQESASRQGPVAPGRKVLLVEDYEPNVLVATAFLDNLGYEYDVARNGAEALKLVGQADYAAVLMDVQMPGMNGYEATGLIRAQEAISGKRNRIIGVTAHALAGDRERCLDAGMDDFIAKPFSQSQLRDMLGQPRSLEVLVVDDNADSALTMSLALEMHNHHVRVVHSGQEAINAATVKSPDVVLMDIGMPEMNGYEACRAMKKLPGLERTIFIAQTGWDSPEHRQESKDAGFSYHLVKPVQLRELVELVASFT